MHSSRRKFVKEITLATAGFTLFHPDQIFAATQAKTKVRLGFIGVGGRGRGHVNNALQRKDVDVVAICDIDAGMLKETNDVLKSSGKPMPQVYTGDPYAYKKMLERKDLDGVIIATPWEWHKPMIIDSLDAGLKYVGTEVVLGLSLEDHWEVVRAAEKNKANVMMLENVCYRRDVMAAMNMVRQGLFGEIIHLQGGYQHNLRGVKFNNGNNSQNSEVEFGEKAYSEAKWRTLHSVHRNGDLYPTHGVGPLAMMVDINRGNRFVSLCSFSSKARGLHDYIVQKGGANHPNAKVEFKLGDVVTTQLKCANGETMLLQHDTDLPRPYSLGFRVQGTKGLWMDVNKSIYIDGAGKDDEWSPEEPWFEKYDHPLWKRFNSEAEGAGHGGMDFFVLHAFVEAIKRSVPTPQDVYDAATWSAITPLSEMSIEMGNERVDFPDFTGGQWMYRKNDFALGNEF